MVDRPHLLQESSGVLTDLHETDDDIVQVQVTEGGMVLALPPHLVQQEVPAVNWRQQVLVFPGMDGFGNKEGN